MKAKIARETRKVQRTPRPTSRPRAAPSRPEWNGEENREEDVSPRTIENKAMRHFGRSMHEEAIISST